MREEFEQAVQELADRFSLTRVRTESRNFEREFKRDAESGELSLVSEKAITRALGKVLKIRIGDDQEFQTFAQAQKFARAHWREYFKNKRKTRTDAEKLGEARRQKRYRDRKKLEEIDISRNQ